MLLPLVQGPFCNGCVNQAYGVKRCQPDGTGANGVALVGDSPWTNEVIAGLPFQGPAGAYLNSILAKRQLERGQFSIYNMMQCKPPHLGWTDHPERFEEAQLAANQCRPYLDKFIAQRRPRALVALGNVAMRGLTGLTDIELNHGYVNESSYGIPTVATFHPSHIIQGAHKLTLAFVLAITRALEVANGTYKPTELQLHEDPSLELLDWYLGGCADYLMCDIETPESDSLDEEKAEDDASYTIVRAGFSTGLGSGCSFPWIGDYISRAQAAIRRARLLLFWNKNYDLPRLLAAGCSLHPEVQIIDAMWLWHWVQSDLPKALAFAAPFFYAGPSWKHLAHKRPAYYNAMDNAVQTLCYAGCREIAIKEGSWDRFMRHAVECEAILVRMGSHGATIDLAARNVFMDELKQDAAKEHAIIQSLVPPGLVQWKKWVRQPKNLEGVEVIELPALHKDGSPAIAEDGKPIIARAWRKKLGLNPNSAPQLRELIKSYGLKVPRKRGEDRETTEQKYLLRFSKKYPVFGHVVNYKRRVKLTSTYQWPLDERMRATSVYGFHPSTWRLSSRKVNLQNIPKRSDLAERFRRMIIASPGNVLVEADGAAIEAVLVGYAAGSESYIRLAKAGIHGWLSSHVLKQPLDWQMPFDELQRACKAIKKANKVVYDGCKHIIHGGNFLFSAFGIYDEFKELFDSERQVKQLLELYFSLPPGQQVRKWQESQIATAHQHKKLHNHFNGTHYFYDLFKYNKRTKANELGDDAKRAVAYVPQSDAAFIQREEFLVIEHTHPWLTPYLFLPTHDSVCADVPERLAESTANVLRHVMSRKWDELEGLDIGVEVTIGRNLAPRSAENPEGMEEVHFEQRAA